MIKYLVFLFLLLICLGCNNPRQIAIASNHDINECCILKVRVLNDTIDINDTIHIELTIYNSINRTIRLFLNSPIFITRDCSFYGDNCGDIINPNFDLQKIAILIKNKEFYRMRVENIVGKGFFKQGDNKVAIIFVSLKSNPFLSGEYQYSGKLVSDSVHIFVR